MHVVPETVYQGLYGLGSLDLAVDPAVSLRNGRTGRRPRRGKEHRTKRFPDNTRASGVGILIGKGGRSPSAD